MYQNALVSQMRLVGIATALALAFGVAGAQAADPILNCQRTLNKESAKFDRARLKFMQKCRDKYVKDVAKGKTPVACPDQKTLDKIAKAAQKFQDKVDKKCTGVSLAEIGWDGLAAECTGGTRDGERCTDGSDCPSIGSGDCQGQCGTGPLVGNNCQDDAVCGQCDGDPDQGCTTNQDCIDASAGTICTSGTCDYTSGQCDGGINPGGACDEEGSADCPGSPGSCDPVDECPGLINDESCSAPLTDATDVVDCLSCTGSNMTDQVTDALYDPVRLGDGDKNTVKCQREIGKRAAKFFDKLRNFKSKCEDKLLKGKVPSCPDQKTLGKINKEIGKLSDKVTGRCSSDALISRAISAARLYAATSRYPGSDCLAEVPSTPQGLADALACMGDLHTDCAGQIALGDTSCSFPDCGDGEIDPGETCDDGNTLNDDGVSAQADTCPADCSIGPCIDGGDQSVSVIFTSSAPLTGLTLLVYYDDTIVSVPGSGAGAGGITSPGFVFSIVPNDLNYATRLVLTDPLLGLGGGVPSGTAVNMALDTCQGAPAPAASDFSCFVIDAADVNFASVPGVTCSVTVP